MVAVPGLAEPHGPTAQALARTARERVLVLLVEFSGSDGITWSQGSSWDPVGSGAVADIVFGNGGAELGNCANIITATATFNYSGPLHNQIERPRSTSDASNTMVWTPDFSPSYYRDVFFGDGVAFNYQRQDGSWFKANLRGQSLASYYDELSGGRYLLDGEVVGWLQVPHSVWWYGADECPGRVSLYANPALASDGAIPGAGSARTLVVDALEAAKQARPDLDWTSFDADGDGEIDHLWVIFAGLGEEASPVLVGRTSYGEGTIWSHIGSLDQPHPVAPDLVADSYVMLPENVGLTALVSHLSYTLGGENLNPVDGGSPSIGNWTPMGDTAVGSPLRFPPAALDPYTLESLGWLEPTLITDGSKSYTVNLGQAGDFPCCSDASRVVKIRLPDGNAPLPVQPVGSFQWWSGRENVLSARMTTRQPIAIPAAGATLTFKLAYDTQGRADFLWVQASSDGGATWRTLTNGHTSCIHNTPWIGLKYGFPGDLCTAGVGGFTGRSEGFPGYLTESFSLATFARQSVLLRFWYMTDWSTVSWGAFIDDIQVKSGQATLLTDGAESGDGKWDYEDGWDRFGATRSYPHAYYLQWRNVAATGGFDAVLGDPASLCGGNESGLLLWYYNGLYPDNEIYRYVLDPPGFGPKGRLLLVDAHPEPYRQPSRLAQGYANEAANILARCQSRDAPFSLHATSDFTLWGEQYQGRPGVAVFNDALSYYPGAELGTLGPGWNPEVWQWMAKHWDASAVIPSTVPSGIDASGYHASDPFYYGCIIYADGKARCGFNGTDTGLGYDGSTGNPGDVGGAYGWHVEILSESDSFANVKIWNSNADCTLVCDATVPAAAPVGIAAPFEAWAEATDCVGAVTHRWRFGDGSPEVTGPAVEHSFASGGLFSWTMTATAGTATCERRGRIEVSAVPEITVLDDAGVMRSGANVPVELGAVTQGQAGIIHSFTVRNDGTAPLALGALTVPVGFTVSDGLPATLAPGASDPFTLRLDSSVVGRKQGEIRLVNSDADENPFTFVVAGTVEPRRFDFGTSTSPVEAGWTRVAASTRYSAAQGFGWASGNVADRDRSTGSALRRDLSFTVLATFAVDLPNGVYLVTLTLGDASAAHDQMGVSLEGVQVDSVSVGKGEFAVITHRAVVGDGQLTVLLDDLGGSDANTVINGMEVVPVPARHFDFGGTTSPLAGGYTMVTPATLFTPELGYGWCNGIVDWRNRSSGTDLTRDLDFTALATFGVAVASGGYQAVVTLGDASGAHDRMGVFLEETMADSVSTAAGQWTTRSYPVTVADGALTVLLDDLGGSDVNAVINALEVTPQAVRRYDFGTTSSPLQAGYARVTPETAYTPWQGYGWLFGSLDSRNRSSGTSLTRDLNFTTSAGFLVDVLDGTYDVALTMGDASAAHDQMGVFVEGVKVDTVSKAAGQFHTGTYRVEVADGLLALVLEDLGGSDANVVINGLEIARVGAAAFDFGTATSPLQAGYTRVTEASKFSAAQGYGWVSGNVASRDRGGASALTRDLLFSKLAVFGVNVPNGIYDVTVTIGDAASAHDLIAVLLENARVDLVDVAKGEFVTRTYRVAVSDGQLTVKIQDLGGSDANAVINALEVR